jgi:hypothetical protein
LPAQVIVLDDGDVREVSAFLEKLKKPPFQLAFHKSGLELARSKVLYYSY